MRILLFVFYPVALLYGFIMFVRNKFFDWGFFKSTRFDFPIISVGNLTVGGTGKTPHVEYLVNLLSKNFKLATLSRGYGRSTNGFLIASKNSTFHDVGDEPVQYCHKFKNLLVAVDEDRVHGIVKIKNDFPPTQAILLDDAFQHRAVQPGLSILLTDFHNLYADDFPLPVGRLREFRSGAKRADIIVVTKTPKVLSPISVRQITGALKPKPHQKLYFSYLKYGELTPMTGTAAGILPEKISSALVFAGIANMYPLTEHVKLMINSVEILEFSDHHKYSDHDLQNIRNTFESIFTRNKIIITTEKDAMRLGFPEVSSVLADLPIYFIPIEIKIHKEYRNTFNEQIENYVRENSGNSSVYKNKNQHSA